MALRLNQISHGFVKKGLIVVDKSTYKIQFIQMKNQSKKFQQLASASLSGHLPIFLYDQTICIADCENLTIDQSLH